MNAKSDLTGKVAIVTGGGGGIGRSIALALAEAGADVAIAEIEPSRCDETAARLREQGRRAAAHIVDVMDGDAIKDMIAKVDAEFGRIDILVNNVGGSAAGGAAELSEDAWNAQIDYNLGSVFLACKHVIPVMIAQGGGAIVNTSSTSGLRYTGAPQVGYAATKAAVIQFSRVTAVQYAKHKIRVNTVVPGQMHTPMVEARLAKQRAGGDIDELLRQRVARIPLGFMGDGRDTANAALFLASDEARFITGTEIVVDGGMTARCD